ncbi:MAG: radical SAM protein, partial [Deltaproteobacteria bacterium]|nr:radical SAM protein [Deltaproteobacteria bacterium]
MKKDYLSNPATLKIDLMLKGVRVQGPLAGAKPFLGRAAMGLDIVLPKGTLVNVPCDEEFVRSSPYILRKSKRGYAITDGKEEVGVRVVPTPLFYGRKTSTGVRFSDIAMVHGSYTVITPSARCDFFKSNIECRYCAGNFDATGKKRSVYSVDEVLETVEAVLKECPSVITYLSIGFSEGPDGGILFLSPYIEAIKKHFNTLIAVEALPPKTNRWIDETYALGADSVLYNLEIFDEELFAAICPGRAGSIGRTRYMEALRYAASIFPNGTVASHLIVGLEPPGSTSMGIDFLASIGVVPILPIYRPRPGGALRIEPLDSEVIIPVYKHLYRAVKKNRINMNWVRDISIVTTPIEGRFLVGEKEGGLGSLVE